MDKIFYPIGVLASLAALCYKLPDLLRDPKSPMLRAFCAAVASLLWGFTFATPVIYVSFDRLVGVPNLARLMMHTGIMALSAALQRLLLYWAYPAEEAAARARRRVGGFLLAVATMTVLFILAPVDQDTTDFTTRYGAAPFVPWYLAVYLGYFGIALADIARLSNRYATFSGRPFLRRGLRSAAIGACFGVVYTVEKASYIVAKQFGIDLVPARVQENASPLLAGPGAILVLAGLTLPAWGPQLASLWAWAARYLAYQRLRPLWQTLYRATESIALEDPGDTGVLRGRIGRVVVRDPQALTDTMNLRDLDYRLVRRVVEIQDGRLALRPYLDAAVADSAELQARGAGLADQELQASVEAAVIAAAVVAKAEEREPAQRYTFPSFADEDLTSETARLGLVSQAIARLRPTRLAGVVTELSAPAVTVAAQLLIVAIDHRTGTAWWALAVLFGSVLPITFILTGARLGRWATHHVPLRRQRAVPMGFGALCMAT